MAQAAFLDLSRILMAENSRPNIDRATLNQGVEIDFYYEGTLPFIPFIASHSCQMFYVLSK